VLALNIIVILVDQ